MRVPVAVSDPVDCYRRGLMASLLEDGYLAEQPDDLFGWAEQPGPRAIMVTLSKASDFATLTKLQGRPAHVVLLVLLTDQSAAAYRAVLAAGAFPVAWDAPPGAIIAVLRAAMDGHVLLPLGLASGLAQRGLASGAAAWEVLGPSSLDDQEIDILGRIARGDTDRKIASGLRLSERTVRRRLQLIFAKLGVGTRLQAGILAVQRGFVGEHPTEVVLKRPS